MKPAWAEQFESGTLRDVAPLDLPEAITTEWAWGGSTGSGIKVAVIDSGIDTGHPAVGEVAGAVVVEIDPDGEDGVRITEGAHDDLFGHGTACAAIIRASAPDVELHSVRVLGESLTGKARCFAEGLHWAIEAGMDVVNLSLSTANDDWYASFHDLTDQAYFARTMVVSAVNNVRKPSYPSEFATVFSVAAHDGTDPERFDYNPDGPVEFGAPGIDLEVAWLDGGTAEVTGNSFAAPHIAALVARILAKHPGLAPFQVKTVLQAVADNTTGIEGHRPNVAETPAGTG